MSYLLQFHQLERFLLFSTWKVEFRAILPFGGYKGYALALLVDVLGGILSGTGTPIFLNYEYRHNGVFVIAIQPTFVRPSLGGPGFEFGPQSDGLMPTLSGELEPNNALVWVQTGMRKAA